MFSPFALASKIFLPVPFIYIYSPTAAFARFGSHRFDA